MGDLLVMDINRMRQLAGMKEEEQIVEARDVTNALDVMMDEGILDPRTVADACLQYMSEDEVADMARANEFPTSEEDVYGDEDDGARHPAGDDDESGGRRSPNW